MRAAWLWMLAGPAVAACGDDLPLRASAGDGAAAFVAFRTDPSPVVVGRHFKLELQVCAKGRGAPPRALRVDAEMPAHRHGMNYRPTLTAMPGAGRWRAEGLMFHMPGRWRFIFDLEAADGRLRLVHEVQVP